MGVLADLLRERFSIDVEERENPVVAALGAAAVVFLRNNPDRVGWVLINLSANNIYISLTDAVGAAMGILLLPNGGNTGTVWDEDFGLCSRAWWGVAPAGASNIYVLELIGKKGLP